MHAVEIVECPRDAMQGIQTLIPTEQKVKYLNRLLKVGFDVLDFGSFVSPKAVPQMQDTKEVIPQLDRTGSKTKLLAIVLNERGTQDALQFEEVDILGYPLSLSEEFSKRNANKTREQAFSILKDIATMTHDAGRELVVYLSMGFGNPYGEHWGPDVVQEYAEKVAELGVKTLSLADTAGDASPGRIETVFEMVLPKLPELTIGAHFHATPEDALKKIEAASRAGCRRFDSAMNGYGGCPFAKDDLTGNIATETLFQFINDEGAVERIDEAQFEIVRAEASALFGQYA